MEMKELTTHLTNRQQQLVKLRNQGLKIVGYFPSNYVPEEIIYASGAMPVSLLYGGDPVTSGAALSMTAQFLCPFARAQLGEKLSGNPLYTVLDMLVSPMSCIHLKKVTEIWEYYYDDVQIFRLGVPHAYSGDAALEYYTQRLGALRDELQNLTGIEITDDRLRNAIDLYNRIRQLLKNISLLRKFPYPPIDVIDFITLNQASLLADPVFMVNILESVYQQLDQEEQLADPNKPRLLLAGPNIAYGDHKVIKLVEESGAQIVSEEVCEGMRYYWQNIDNEGALLGSIARGYLRDRLPCAFMDSPAKIRFDYIMTLIEEFNISGVIWYQMLYCETYDAESQYFIQNMKENKVPVLVIDSDYMSDTGQLRIRIEAFVEMLKGGIV
jgi:benzoyl-CoA reductase/2-hydroxyglutaryl-CoA dehydratase subunit BcrC/BadD/HgdB